MPIDFTTALAMAAGRALRPKTEKLMEDLGRHKRERQAAEHATREKLLKSIEGNPGRKLSLTAKSVMEGKPKGQIDVLWLPCTHTSCRKYSKHWAIIAEGEYSALRHMHRDHDVYNCTECSATSIVHLASNTEPCSPPEHGANRSERINNISGCRKNLMIYGIGMMTQARCATCGETNKLSPVQIARGNLKGFLTLEDPKGWLAAEKRKDRL